MVRPPPVILLPFDWHGFNNCITCFGLREDAFSCKKKKKRLHVACSPVQKTLYIVGWGYALDAVSHTLNLGICVWSKKEHLWYSFNKIVWFKGDSQWQNMQKSFQHVCRWFTFCDGQRPFNQMPGQAFPQVQAQGTSVSTLWMPPSPSPSFLVALNQLKERFIVIMFYAWRLCGLWED